jgi:hypothetical protein
MRQQHLHRVGKRGKLARRFSVGFDPGHGPALTQSMKGSLAVPLLATGFVTLAVTQRRSSTR